MKRHLFTIAVFLLAGAVVNVAVAWGCAAWTPISTPISTQIGRPYTISSHGVPGSRPLTSSEQQWWLADRGAALLPPLEVIDHRSIGVTMRQVFHRRPALVPRRGSPPSLGKLGDRTVQEWHLYSAGWPLRSLDGLVRHYHLHGVTGELPNGTHEYVDLIRRPANSGAYRPLPLGPIWLGFAVNTLFYAAVLWLLICGPFALRRLIRVRRGLCPGCGYLVGESDVCTECGMALVPG